MSTYILVHGSWAGAWGWERVLPYLAEAGHVVIAPDLPAHGTDRTPLQQATLSSYVNRINSFVDGESGPVILVGHSMGGAVISEVAETRPEKVSALVYLSGYLLQNGQSIMQMAQQDAGSILGPNMIVDEQEGTAILPPEVLREGFFNGVSPKDLPWAMSHVRPEPIAPFMTPVTVSEANFGRAPRVYITTLQDRAITPAAQQRMYSALPCQVAALDTGHCSFLSMPDALAAQLLNVREMVGVAL
jgi:pimeloyl-ACP methyl ester carboxylesterase